MSREDFSLYILRCADGSLYTGISCDVPGRIAMHENGAKGAKYLKGRTPLTLVFEQMVGSRSRAQRLECRVKKLRRAEKQALVAGRVTLDQLASA